MQQAHISFQFFDGLIARCAQAFSKGIHYWEININKFARSTPYIMIGVTPKKPLLREWVGFTDNGIR
jgi:hypothetical protein